MGKPVSRLWRVAWVAAGLALAPWLLGPDPARGEPLPCADAMFAVDAGDARHAAQLCAIAPSVRDGLAECGLLQNRVLTFEVTDRLAEPFDTCLANFDCRSDLIGIVDPAAYPELLAEGSAYARLPRDVLLRALVTHEMAHALAFQSAADREIDVVDQEYIAAAMELELMPPEWREVLIAAAPVSLPPKEGMIDIWIYSMAPRKFAVNAWRHFRLPENGCKLVQRIVAGEESFSKSLGPDLR